MDEAFKGRDTIDYVTKAVDCFQTCNVAESEDIQEQDEEMLRLCICKISKGLYVKHSRQSFIQGCIINLAGAYELRKDFPVVDDFQFRNKLLMLIINLHPEGCLTKENLRVCVGNSEV
ncbi:hypothetical protein DPMN_047805 [Dreissena polymorpha]|uniref:Uncharacterized protein n=2 Tax=Dreissena polymorpha TaxID=45954 RepID=A0A9D4DAE2_DREPO|nr:hypothetical protein DPMN_047805 [Dreissena polymorpha]